MEVRLEVTTIRWEEEEVELETQVEQALPEHPEQAAGQEAQGQAAMAG